MTRAGCPHYKGKEPKWFTGMADMRSAGKVTVMNMDDYRTETRIDFAASLPECPVCGGGRDSRGV